VGDYHTEVGGEGGDGEGEGRGGFIVWEERGKGKRGLVV
jgi:hypothetical protein